MSDVFLPLGRYRHFKHGDLYDVIGLATHSESGEQLIVYRSVAKGALWVRPVAMFTEMVERDGYRGPRFTLLEERITDESLK